MAAPLEERIVVGFMSPRAAGQVVRRRGGLGSGTADVNPKATILIVDDESDVREVLEEYFAAHGYMAVGAESADAAKAIVASRAIDLALVDIHMPGEDGLSLARHLRERYWEGHDSLVI